jgi:L-seryl-tRNA(Ser) seleniumtransferase
MAEPFEKILQRKRDAAGENPLRAVPSVDEVLRYARVGDLVGPHSREVVLAAVRDALAEVRAALLAGAPFPGEAEIADRVGERVADAARPRLCRAINATGVVLHTGLGRAPLSPEARRAIEDVARGYSVLEIDRETGERGEREAPVAALLRELAGAEAATVVNNNAAACLLALAALCRGKEVIVARGQLVEIGGSFRIPEVMEESGARLREVGATNKVRRRDYERAIGPETAAILKVHTSNFKVVGFHEEVPIADLAALARERGLLLLEDLGSGNLVDLAALGIGPEPLVRESVAAGADVVTFSGDKLLGGPQAGLAVGRKDAIARMRAHPLFRALRPDKLTLAGLEATLRLYRGEGAAGRVTALRLLGRPAAEIEARARALAARLADLDGARVEVLATDARAGSGALPIENVPSFAVAISPVRIGASALAARLRLGEPPVFPRIKNDAVLLDLRTIFEEEEEEVEAAVRIALRSGSDGVLGRSLLGR